jgi:hypothetical protein
MMKRRILVAIACTLAAGTMASAQDSVKMDPALLTAKEKVIEAQRTCNVALANEWVTDDMLFIHANGILQDKKAFGDFVKTCTLADIRFDVDNVRTYGDVAVLSGKLPFKMKQGTSMSFFVSEVYVKRNGKWLFASHQSTDAASFIASMKPPAGSK